MPREDPKTSSASRPEPIYSIRFGGPEVTCDNCGERFQGPGPVGYRDDAPVCDLCFLAASADLGMILALVAVTRAYAAISPKGTAGWLDPLQELGAFARVYELIAAKSGPPRIFRYPGSTEQDTDPGSVPPEADPTEN